MVEVFKTNIKEKDIADAILKQLKETFPSANFNFDLEDCDRILRMESRHVSVSEVEEFLFGLGFYSEALL